jgi:site-specific DNA recombinase
MYNPTPAKNAIGAIRVSSMDQGTHGDSPDAQQEQIERYASAHGITIKKFFVFLESASKEQQPIQEAIDYCKNPENKINLFIIKSIDRFTRGGSDIYNPLKSQLDVIGVSLVDIYGVISGQKINTLDHLGLEYDWSVYSPTKKAEILEAERAKDEIRDIMSRMIGAQVRYARMGYWVRRAPYGYVEDKVETEHGKRCMLKPHPEEAKIIRKMFELRLQGTHTDNEIIEELNKLGYKSRIDLIRDKNNRARVIKEKGGKPLDIKGFTRMIENPTYAGINFEKWLQGKAIKMRFPGLISIEEFNKANRGKITIKEKEDGEVTIERRIPKERHTRKGHRHPDFPYKKIIMCPECEKPLFGSASRGRLGKYYPAYHCNKRGHYFRVPKKDFDKAVEGFVKSVTVSPRYIDSLEKAVNDEWERRKGQLQRDDIDIDTRITELRTKAKMITDKMMYLQAETAIKHMEEELIKTEDQTKVLLQEKEKKIMENYVAGMEGFEPPNAWTKTRCLTTWPHPNNLVVKIVLCLLRTRFWSMDYCLLSHAERSDSQVRLPLGHIPSSIV